MDLAVFGAAIGTHDNGSLDLALLSDDDYKVGAASNMRRFQILTIYVLVVIGALALSIGTAFFIRSAMAGM